MFFLPDFAMLANAVSDYGARLIETKTYNKGGVLLRPLRAGLAMCERVLRHNSVLWLAWRNLIHPRRGFGLSVMTFVSIAGVTIGVLALTVVLSVMGGFERDMKAKMLKGLPHLEVYLRDNPTHGFSLHEYPLSWFQKTFPQAALVEPFIQVDVVLKHNRHLSSAVLFAVEPTKGGQLWGFRQQDALLEGSYQGLRSREGKTSPGILLGDGLAVQMGAEVGDDITILNPNSALSAAGGLATTARVFTLAGIFHTGLFTYDGKWAVIALAEGRKFLPDYDVSLDEEQYVSGVALNFPDPDRVDSIAPRLAQDTPEGLDVEGDQLVVDFCPATRKICYGGDFDADRAGRRLLYQRHDDDDRLLPSPSDCLIAGDGVDREPHLSGILDARGVDWHNWRERWLTAGYGYSAAVG